MMESVEKAADVIVKVLNEHKDELSDGYSFYGTEVTEDVLRKIAKEILIKLDITQPYGSGLSSVSVMKILHKLEEAQSMKDEIITGAPFDGCPACGYGKMG